MRVTPTRVAGAFLLEVEWHADERGRSGRAWSTEELEAHGLTSRMVVTNVSITLHAGTLRGLHYQPAAYGEAKIVRCVRGRIFDVVADVREDSPTYGKWDGFEMKPEDHLSLYVPPGAAHGFLCLADDTEVVYSTSAAHSTDTERGLRWDDPGFAVQWPGGGPRLLSAKDRAWPDHKRST